MSTPTKQSALATLKARRQQAASGMDPASNSSGGAPVPAEASPTPSTAQETKPPTGSTVSSLASKPGTSLAPRPAPARAPSPSAAGPGPGASNSQPAARTGPTGSDPDPGPLPTREVEAFAWVCGTCQRECVPVRSESRCLCGHRLREHDPASTRAPSRCKAAKCTCRGFFFVVAEGAWVLRCRCKHKHVEHDPATHACAKAGCSCRDFDSPWVCNCDHPWADHKQLVQVKQVVSVRDMMGGLTLAEVGGGGPAREVNDYDGLKRGDLGAMMR